MLKFGGKRPQNLGITDGGLHPCPDTPNCVCSAAPGPAHVAPLEFEGSAKDGLEKLAQVLSSMRGCEITAREGNYLHAEFRTAWLGFIDDFEALFEEDQPRGRLEIRSASRMGHSDLGVNRKRIERIRTQFNRKP